MKHGNSNIKFAIDFVCELAGAEVSPLSTYSVKKERNKFGEECPCMEMKHETAGPESYSDDK